MRVTALKLSLGHYANRGRGESDALRCLVQVLGRQGWWKRHRPEDNSPGAFHILFISFHVSGAGSPGLPRPELRAIPRAPRGPLLPKACEMAPSVEPKSWHAARHLAPRAAQRRLRGLGHGGHHRPSATFRSGALRLQELLPAEQRGHWL